MFLILLSIYFFKKCNNENLNEISENLNEISENLNENSKSNENLNENNKSNENNENNKNNKSTIIINDNGFIINQIIDSNENLNEDIPKVIYLTHKNNIPEYVINNWKKLNPKYDIKFYNDDACREFIAKNFPISYLNYFDHLSKQQGAGPIKSDFWRCLILYKYGGVYADSDIELLVPIKEFLEKDTDFLVCNCVGENCLNPHLIMSRRNNIILKKCIEIYVNEIFNIPYSYWKHSIVFIMTKAFQQLGIYHKPWTNNIIITNKKSTKKMEESTKKIEESTKKIEYNIQILDEIYPDDDYSNHYCTYKDKKVLNNRFSSYDYVNHTF